MSKVYIWLAPALIAIFFACVASGAEENKYVGDNEKNCGLCHKDQVAAWKKWPMAKAWDRIKDEKSKDKCMKCHVTGMGKPGGFVSFEKTPKLVNVQCEACHGPAGAHMKVPVSDKAKKKATMSKPTEATCKVCHTKEGNPNYKDFKYEEFKKKLADHLPKK